MNRMTSQVVGTWCTAALLSGSLVLGVGGCKKEEAPTPSDKPPAGEMKPPEPSPKPPEPPKPMTADEQVKWYQDCWTKFNNKAWDDFKKCYADDVEVTQVDSGMPAARGPDAAVASAQMFSKAFPDVVGEPQLILQNGHSIAGVWLIKGTNSGPMMAPDGKEMPATNKKIGLLSAHVIEANETGKASKEFFYSDQGTMMAQLGLSKMPGRPIMDKGAASPTVVIAKDDDTEKKNLDAFKAGVDAWNKHDAKAFEANLADDVKWSEQATPKDQNKKEMMKGLAEFWKGMSDVKLNVSNSWAAGDYVVAMGTADGTNDADMPSMKLKKTGKKVSLGYLEIDRFEGGKIKEGWLFYNSAAMAQQLGMMPAAGAAPEGKGEKGAAAPGEGEKAPAGKEGKEEKPAKEGKKKGK
jgi:predicted ester cyclase